MIKIKKHIEIVSSTERGLSSMGRTSRTDIQAIVSKRYSRVDVTMVNDHSDLDALVARRPDLVFLGMKFIPADPALGATDPNKIWLSEYLEAAGITSTGSGHTAIELELNKELAKQRIIDSGLSTPKFQVIRQGEVPTEQTVRLSYPLFVKPTNGGGGGGVDVNSLAYTLQQLQSKVRSLATSFGCDAMVEEYLPGREFSVGILRQSHRQEYARMPLEIIAPPNASGARFLSCEIKLADTEQTVPVTDEVLKHKISKVAIQAFHALGAQDYGRIDIRLDSAGTPHFLEANLLPSLVRGYGNFPKSCLLNLGLAQESMILNIVDLALERAAKARQDGVSTEITATVPLGLAGGLLATA